MKEVLKCVLLNGVNAVKIANQHYDHMKNMIQPLMVKVPYSVYQNKGLSGKRYRWDIARAAGLMAFICDELYVYLNDEHIDTALRNITGVK